MRSTTITAAITVALSLSAGVALSQQSRAIQPASRDETRPAAPLDTRSFFPQINTELQVQPREIENPIFRGRRSTLGAPPSGVKVGGVTQASRIEMGPKYPGIGFTGWRPPDPTIGVGPNHVVATVNVSISWFDKNTGVTQFQQTLNQFFQGVATTGFVYDPKVFYDRFSNRYVLMALEQSDNPQISGALVAVSDDSDPNGTWYRYRFEAKNAGAWMDYPGWGLNKDAYVICGNMFGFSGGFGGVQWIVIRKSSILNNGSAVSFKFFDTSGGSAQVIENQDTASNFAYSISDWTTASLKLYAFSNLTGTPTQSSTILSVPSYAYPSVDAPSTNGRTLDSLDGRIYNAMVRNNHMMATHTVRSSSSSVNRPRWYDIDLNNWPTSGSPTLDQSGEVFAGGTTHNHMGTICRNANDDVAMVFTQSNASSITADIMVTGRKAGDAPGTMGAPVRLDSSSTSSYGDAGLNRWGDYSMITVDPDDGTTFWAVHMTGAATQWRTSINRFTIPNVTRANPSAFSVFRGSVNSGGLSELLNSDDSYLVVRNGPIALPSESPITVIIDGSTTLRNPTKTTFLFEGKVSIANLSQSIDLFDYSANSYTTVDTRNGPTVDTPLVLDQTTNPGRFIGPTGSLSARIRVKPAGVLFTNNWNLSIDQAGWEFGL